MQSERIKGEVMGMLGIGEELASSLGRAARAAGLTVAVALACGVAGFASPAWAQGEEAAPAAQAAPVQRGGAGRSGAAGLLRSDERGPGQAQLARPDGRGRRRMGDTGGGRKGRYARFAGDPRPLRSRRAQPVLDQHGVGADHGLPRHVHASRLHVRRDGAVPREERVAYVGDEPDDLSARLPRRSGSTASRSAGATGGTARFRPAGTRRSGPASRP